MTDLPDEAGWTATDSPWDLPEQEPSNFVVLWPGDEPPTLTEVRAAFASATGQAEVEEELATEEHGIPWGAVLQVAGREVPIIAWAEPARPLPEEEAARIGATRCAWAVGVETMLDIERPLEDYAELVRLVAGALADSPAVLDVNTAHWFTQHDVEEMFGSSDPIDPPAEVLWTIHAVSPSPGHDGSEPDGSWLHTHGLWRCGRAELEILEVPRRHLASAGHLLNCIAETMLDRDLPEPGEPFDIGADLTVAAQPWSVVAPSVRSEHPGSMRDRDDEEENAHVGVRAVICAERPRGALRADWIWPRSVIERLEDGASVIYMTEQATARRAARAAGTWGQLATAFATCRQRHRHDEAHPECVFLVKAPFADPDDETRREHLWFEVSGFEGEQARGLLVNAPMFVTTLSEGDETLIERSRLSDWHVGTTLGAFGPYETSAMWRALDELGEEPDE